MRQTNTTRRRRKSAYELFMDELLELQRDGSLNSPSPTFFNKLNSKISGVVENLYVKSWNNLFHYRFNPPFRKSFYKQKHKIKRELGVRGYRLNELTKEFADIYKNAQTAALSLIKSQSSKNMDALKARLINWVSNEQVRNKEKLKSYVKLDKNKWLNTILRDQVGKMTASMDLATARHFKAVAFQWLTHNDDRVVGKPGGINPKGNEMHGNHWVRKDKWYYYSDRKDLLIEAGIRLSDFDGSTDDLMKKDGLPGMAINCRCVARNIYRVQDLPHKFTKHL